MVATMNMQNGILEDNFLQESLDSVYNQYYKNVYRYILFRVTYHYDAEELTNDVFVKAIRNQKKYNPCYSMEAWLIGIAKNTVTDYLRKNMRLKFVSLDDVTGLNSADRQPEEIAVTNEEVKQLVSAMAKLKDKERQILSMKFATDLKHKEIADVLGISEVNARVRAHMALNKLKKLMEVSYEK